MNLENYVIIIGSSNMDLIIYSEKLPNKGQTVSNGRFETHLGGKGANQAVASTRAGSKTYFIANIGLDNYGDNMIKQLAKEGVQVEYIVRDNENPSGIAFIMVDKIGENLISVAPGSNALLIPEKIKNNSHLIERANVVMVQMEIPTETISEIFRIASKGNAIKILNPAPLKKLPRKVFELIDIIIPNEGELIEINALYNLGKLPKQNDQKVIKASQQLSKLGPKAVITTLGSSGSCIYKSQEKEFIHIPALKVNAIDTVGAGDCFNGVFASFLNKEESIIDAVRYATIAASIAVSRKGAQDSMPFLDEIISKNKNL